MNPEWGFPMRIPFQLCLAFVVVSGLWAQTPQTRITYEDRVNDAGHVLVVDGKNFGPYKEILSSSYSTSGTAIAFAASKADRIWILAQGKESGPLPVGFDLDRLQIADDGKVWVLTATRTGTSETDPNETLLWVNGHSFGPYPELTSVEYAETGGLWIAAVRPAADEAEVLMGNVKPLGPFFSVDHVWLSPDGKTWGYAASDSEGRTTVVTTEKTWTGVLSANFTYLYPREPHWGYSLDLSTGEERIVVDGHPYEGYRNFRGLVLTPSGRHWGFEAEKALGANSPVVVVDGKEYPGDTLLWSRLGSQETFSWSFRDNAKVTVQTLKLP